MRTPKNILTLAHEGLSRVLQIVAYHATPPAPEGREASITYVTEEARVG